ncbi:MAG: hypothetical protein KGI27_04910 [Thaumarchaeota archaeon]|nr:hypothetical protein [Nitrososphaerota archaeon]
MNDTEKREKSSGESTRKVSTAIDRVNQVSAVVSIILLAFVITSTLFPNVVSLPVPSIFSWYGLAFSFFLWFSTRKGGCGSCNQGCSY